jgi:hypothetical protein
MNNFSEVFKNQISIFCISADGFQIFLHLYCLEKCFLRSLLILEFFTEAAEFPHPQQDKREPKRNCEPQFMDSQ